MPVALRPQIRTTRTICRHGQVSPFTRCPSVENHRFNSVSLDLFDQGTPFILGGHLLTLHVTCVCHCECSGERCFRWSPRFCRPWGLGPACPPAVPHTAALASACGSRKARQLVAAYIHSVFYVLGLCWGYTRCLECPHPTPDLSPPVPTRLPDSFFMVPLGHHLLQETCPTAQAGLSGPLCPEPAL